MHLLLASGSISTKWFPVSVRRCATRRGSRTPARAEQPLVDLGDRAVVGVDDVGDGHLRDLGQQLIGVEPVQAVQITQPADHLDLAGPPRFLERPAGPIHIRWVSVSILGQAGPPPWTRSTITVTFIAPSTAVPHDSPSPWR